MQFIIHSKKYDGRSHLEWPADLLRRGDQTVVHAGIGTVGTHFTRGIQWTAEYHAVAIFPEDAWYNFMLVFDADGGLIRVYCNIGLPPIVTDNRLEFVDLDLDVVWTPSDGAELVDEEEFVEHSALYGYPPEVVEGARAAANLLLERAGKGEAPFADVGMGEALRSYGDAYSPKL